jgi:hypothetical protein
MNASTYYGLVAAIGVELVRLLPRKPMRRCQHVDGAGWDSTVCMRPHLGSLGACPLHAAEHDIPPIERAMFRWMRHGHAEGQRA